MENIKNNSFLEEKKLKRISLDYSFGDLEPVIFFRTSFYHYEEIHKYYENKLNDLISELEVFKENEKKFKNPESIISNINLFPQELQKEIISSSKGLMNHNFFFQNLKKCFEKKNEDKINAEFLNKIKSKFGDLENLKKSIVNKSLSLEGSGWVWLIINEEKELEVISTENEDNPFCINEKLSPLLAIDIWEHSYYIEYGPNRKEYVEKFFENLIDWEKINEIFLNSFLPFGKTKEK